MTLRAKLLAFTVVIVAVLTSLSLVVVHRFVVRQVERDLKEDLHETEAVFSKFMDERVQWLRSQCLVVAEDPRFNAPLDIQEPDFGAQAETVRRESEKFREILRSNLFVVTDRTGRTLARLELFSSSERDLTPLQGVTEALSGETGVNTWSMGTHDVKVATVPVYDAEQIVGTLAVGFSTGQAADYRKILADLESTARDLEVGSLLREPDVAEAASRVQEVQSRFRSDLTALSDGSGRSVALYQHTATSGEDLSQDPLIQDALRGQESSFLFGSEEERLFQIVVVPVWSEDRVVGTLTTGLQIDDSLAHDLREMTHSDVSFALAGQVVASTLTPDAVQAVEEMVLDTSQPPTPPGEVFEVALAGENYLSLLRRWERTDGFYLIQSSRDQAIAFLTTLERTQIGVGLGILLAGALISFLGIARIAHPLRALVEGTRRLGAGDLDYRIEVGSEDELGELAVSFNDMSSALASSHEALRESERQYRDLFDNARDMVYTTDLDMNLTSVNKAGLTLTGYSPGELLGKSFYTLVSPEDVTDLKTTERSLEPGQPRPAFEAEIVRQDGSRASLEVVSRWMLREGHVVGIHGIGRDLSERRQRERVAHRLREQLYQTEKLRALGEMAAGVAHNFNNLLTGIMGHAELIACREITSREIRDDANRIVEWTHRCAAIVRRIRTFGRPVDTHHREKILLPRLIQDTLEVTRPKWETQPQREGRTVKISLDVQEVPPISSNEGAMEEILSNLIFNAVDAMPHGGEIAIATRVEDDQVVLAVTDDGIGMDESTRRRAFEPFYTTKGPELGTGLGLSTVWGLVQSLGGEIEIGSTPGKGTSFFVRVPVTSEETPDGPPTDLPPLPAGLRILVVDDEAATRDTLFRLLSEHEVSVAESGEQGLELFAEGDYELVISDWSMTGITGLEVADAVKRKSPDSVVVLTSGWELQGTAASRSPAIDFLLQKPIERQELERILRQAQHLLRRPAGTTRASQVG